MLVLATPWIIFEVIKAINCGIVERKVDALREKMPIDRFPQHYAIPKAEDRPMQAFGSRSLEICKTPPTNPCLRWHLHDLAWIHEPIRI
jgi:hypothetical protein